MNATSFVNCRNINCYDSYHWKNIYVWMDGCLCMYTNDTCTNIRGCMYYYVCMPAYIYVSVCLFMYICMCLNVCVSHTDIDSCGSNQ